MKSEVVIKSQNVGQADRTPSFRDMTVQFSYGGKGSSVYCSVVYVFMFF